ncbi:MAG: FtsP/CotA-like multicopper oxidase with cupredoxin domain [Pseudohongiellaceae bacterium]|jgi:FtsP/CotA-like multicopper oxidase with cupredoxin domain
MLSARLLLSSLSALVLCGVTASAQFQEPPVAVDVNPSPTIVEIFLEASPVFKGYFGAQTATAASAFNGSIPGPTLEANLGDTLIVHFTNNLPDDTTIHWHGIEGPAQMDGSHISQKPIPANGGTFDYQFDLLTAGMFWYHPHMRTNEAVESGLYGAILVRDPVGEAGLGLPTIERVMIYDDILLDPLTNQIETHFPSDPVENVAERLNGRTGNFEMINGQIAPVVYSPQNGVPERWRILNAANTHFLRLSFEDTISLQVQTVFRIGGDGGLLEAPIQKPRVSFNPPPSVTPGGYSHISSQDPEEGIFLVPGERADVVWTPNALPGEQIFVRNHPWNRGAHAVLLDPGGSGNIVLGDDLNDGLGIPNSLFRITTTGAQAPAYIPPAVLRDIDEIDPLDVIGTLNLTMGHSLPPFAPDGSGLVLFIQGMGLPMPKVTGPLAHDVEIGQTYMWEVRNLTHMDHPFHTHGWAFQPVELQYTHVSDPMLNFTVPFTFTENKDTLRIPGRVDPVPFSSSVIFRALATFNEDGREGLVRAEGLHPADDVSGGWLAHCHILEHSASGMMTFFETRYAGHTSELMGFGLAGVAGIPEMRIDGPLMGGTLVTMSMTNGAANAPVGIFAGLTTINAPFKGGTLYPAPDLLIVLNNDGNGELNLAGNWPAGIPAGFEVFWQIWSQDVAGVNGFSASNGVKTIAQ